MLPTSIIIFHGIEPLEKKHPYDLQIVQVLSFALLHTYYSAKVHFFQYGFLLSLIPAMPIFYQQH